MPSIRDTNLREAGTLPDLTRNPGNEMKTETQILRASLIATLVVSGLGIVFGLASGSFAIVFDGVFSLVDASMTLLSMGVANLITRSIRDGGLSSRLNDRFSMGFWHFEPMVVALNATVLLAVTSYALLNAILALQDGGREMSFGPAIIYAVVVVIICFTMGYLEHKANKRIKSDFVLMDIKGWVMAGGISFSLVIAFGLGMFIDGTSYEWIMPYIDPAVLALVCIVLLPVPFSTLMKAVAEVVMMTPADLKAHVDEVCSRFVESEAFLGHNAFVARFGRADQIEIYFIVPPEQPPRRLEEWDELRDRLGAELGKSSPHRWLTIAFTTDPHRAA